MSNTHKYSIIQHINECASELRCTRFLGNTSASWIKLKSWMLQLYYNSNYVAIGKCSAVFQHMSTDAYCKVCASCSNLRYNVLQLHYKLHIATSLQVAVNCNCYTCNFIATCRKLQFIHIAIPIENAIQSIATCNENAKICIAF